MAKELAHFKNFAKLKDTSVEFNDITVLAGKPGIGKSYVMKLICILSALNNSSTFLLDMFRKVDKNLNVDEYRNTLNEFSKIVLDEYLETNSKEKVYALLAKNLLNSVFDSVNQINSNFDVVFNGNILIYKNKKIKFNKEKSNLFCENALFIETPLILEMFPFMVKDQNKLPAHIHSLINSLEKSYEPTSTKQDKFKEKLDLKIQEIINGTIKKSINSFEYIDSKGKTFNILNASTGIKSIGLLQYLISNNAVKKDTILFWEEPEVHLHPEWQLRMVELFVELMNAGVKIVFSTHSPYMCDYLNAISQKNSFDDRVSFNLFEETNGVVDNHILNDENWNKIQAELLDPLEEIMWEYI